MDAMDIQGRAGSFLARVDPDDAGHEHLSPGSRWRSWLTVLLALVAAAAAVVAILAFQGRADEARRGQLVLADVATEANRQSALEWQAVVEGGLSEEVSRELGALRRRIDREVQVLIRADSDDRGSVRALTDRLSSYQAAVDEQFRLLEAGRLEAAELIDEERVDPAFERLEAQLARIRADEDQVAASASRMATIGTLASLGLAAAGLLLLFRALGRSRRRVAQARERQLERDASHDFLTGLPNRRKLMADLARELAASDEDRPRLLVMFDLDGFKAYNDSFGHPEGDLLLRRLSAKLAAALGTGGMAYRLGGDEFCALARVGGAEAEAVVAGCVEALCEDGEGFRIRTSSGRVLLPGDAADATSALLLADQRMYEQKDRRSSSAKQQTRDLLLSVLAERHPELRDHASTVAETTRSVAATLGLGGAEVDDVVRATELHDIGKMAIPEAILHKPGPLDDEEWQFMRRHPVIGERILSAAPALARTATLVRSSHERPDGCGYPDGLRGEEIPLGSRIVFVCAAFDAMTSERPHQSPMSTEQALAELRRCAGAQFDPAVVEAFCEETTKRAQAKAGAPSPAYSTSARLGSPGAEAGSSVGGLSVHGCATRLTVRRPGSMRNGSS